MGYQAIGPDARRNLAVSSLRNLTMAQGPKKR
jgi:hypothetical protein